MCVSLLFLNAVMLHPLITVTATACERVPRVAVDVFRKIKKGVKRAAAVKVDIIMKSEAQLAGLAATI